MLLRMRKCVKLAPPTCRKCSFATKKIMAENAALRRRLLDVEFVEGAAEDWECPICKQTLLDPLLLSCCGHHFCEACVERLQNRPCPLCNDPEFTALLDKGRQRLVMQEKVHCPNNENGCQWLGELCLLMAHLAGSSPRVPPCQNEPVPCVNDGCGEQVLRINLDQHRNTECMYRKLVCQYCNDVETTYKELSEVHWHECQDFLVPCPNNCGVEEMRRSEVKTHCDRNCQAQIVKCPFWEVGCGIRRPRKDLPVHVKASDEHHSQLLVKKMVEMQMKLAEQDTAIKSLTEECERKTAAENEARASMEAELQRRDEAIQRLGEEAGQQAAESKKSIEERDSRIAALMTEFDAKLKERDEKIENLSTGFVEKLKESAEKVAALTACFEKKLEDRDMKIEAVATTFDSEMETKTAELAKHFEEKHEEDIAKLSDELAQVVTTAATIQTTLGMEAEENHLHKLGRETGALREDFAKLKQDMKAEIDNSLTTFRDEQRPLTEDLRKTLLQQAGKDADTKVAALEKELVAKVGAVEKKTDDKFGEFAQEKNDITEQLKQQETGWRETQGALDKKFSDAVADGKKETQALTMRVDTVEAAQKQQVGRITKEDLDGEVERVKLLLQGKIKDVEEDIKYVENSVTPTPPFSFTVSRFSKRREKKESFVSDPFYTSRRGYRMVVRVDSAGTDTHVSVWCCITRGQHDSHLPWPLRADIYVRLVNQKDSKKDYERQISYDKQALAKHAGKVTTGDKNYLWGLREFITLKEVQNGHFLVGDALDFVVDKVELKEMDRKIE